MRTMNRAIVIGHIGSEIVLRNTKNGTPVVNLSVATNVRRKDGVESTTWHRAVLWDRLAEYAGQYLKKGDAVYLEGTISSNNWTDKEGVKHYRNEINARELISLRGRSEGMAGSERRARPAGQRADGAEVTEVTEDIPF